MVDILTAAASRSEAGASVREIVTAARRAGRSLPVARASVSRALRRLWLRGAVELHDRRCVGAGRTMSERRQRAREIVAAAQANPEQFYKGALRFYALIRKHNYDPWGSADACVAAKERQAEELPKLRTVRVTVTPSGRSLLEHRLTLPLAGELTAGAQVPFAPRR